MSEFVPRSQLKDYGVVGADSAETVAAVRQRLLEPGHDQYNAPILIRLANGSIAPTSAPMLRKEAQERGPAILEQRLEDLLPSLCPEPWSVEGQEAATQEARRRRLPVIVTEGGQFAGLMVPLGRLALSVPRNIEQFDLLDEPLRREELPPTEFVAATLDTIVAGVARDLKALHNPGRAYVVVEGDGGLFQILPVASLNDEVKRRGEEVWTTPLRQLASVPSLAKSLEAAASREYDTVGARQAEALEEKGQGLVLTDRGKPVALIPPVKRLGVPTFTGPAIAPGAHDLYTIPQATLGAYLAAPQPPSAPEGGPRFANLWFEGAEGQTVEQSLPLVVGTTYYLALNIGRLREFSIMDWDPARRPPHLAAIPDAVPIVEPGEEWSKLYASVFSQDFEIGQTTQLLTLPPEDDSAPVRFEVRPLRRTFGEKDRATLDVCLYYRCSLVQSFQVQVEVRTEGEKPHTRTPQRAELKAARLEAYPELDQITPKTLNLTITKRPDGSYQFTFTLTPEAVQDPRWEAIRFGYPVRLRREDLTHLITKARRQLYNIARSPDYQGSLAGTPAAQRLAMKALATVGRQLYLQLFRPRDQEGAGATVAEWIAADNLKSDSTIQIVDRAGDFVFPWALIYDRSPWESKEIDPQGFWGIRYQIELLTDGLLKRYEEVKPVIEAEQVSLGVGLYDYLPGAEQQRAFFEGLKKVAGTQVKADLFNSTPPLRRALESADQHLLYFFCHGFTERMAADIQLGDDLIAEFRALPKAQADQQQAEREEDEMTHYEALFDVSDSWLQLTKGTAPLTLMEDTLLAKEARFRNGPLVFLNMCESAQVLPSLSGGFIPFFLDYGARGVIGTECPMTSTFADPFAQEFLRRFFQGQPAGLILLELRRKFLKEGNPLGLAYTLYCDADVRLANGIPVPDVT